VTRFEGVPIDDPFDPEGVVLVKLTGGARIHAKDMRSGAR
jgi:hypothetical protein